MITKIIDSFNGFNLKYKDFDINNITSELIQRIYDNLTIDCVIEFSCPTCNSHSFISWGYYYRTLIVLMLFII